MSSQFFTPRRLVSLLSLIVFTTIAISTVATGQEKSADLRWKMHTIKRPWPNAVTVIVADLNNDGRLDIAASAERGANELRWWRNEGRLQPDQREAPTP